MSSVCLFQKYSSKENVHSSNALLLLKRVYYYSPKIFYKVLATWIECEDDELLPAFIFASLAIVIVSLLTKAPDDEVTVTFEEVKAMK